MAGIAAVVVDFVDFAAIIACHLVVVDFAGAVDV